MSGEGNEQMMDYGLTPDEARALRGELDTGEWEGLLAAQRALLNAPAVPPPTGFADRVLTRLAARERAQARRHAVLGVLALGCGALLVTGLLLWSLPPPALLDPGTWALLLDAVVSWLAISTTLIVSTQTFAQVAWAGGGGWLLLTLALFALGSTVLWTRVAAGNAPVRVTA